MKPFLMTFGIALMVGVGLLLTFENILGVDLNGWGLLLLFIVGLASLIRGDEIPSSPSNHEGRD